MDKVRAILEKNKDKDFVKRILAPDKYPVITNKDGSISTHLMSWGQSDNGYFVYPTIINTKEGLKRLSDDEAWNHAISSKEFIRFDSPEEADWFSKNYKSVWRK